MRFSKHWINLIHRAATSTRKTRVLLTPIGVAIFGVFTALFVFAAVIIDGLLGLPGLLPVGAKLSLSITLMALGIAITAWSVIHFMKVKGTPVPFNPPPKLVKTGPYRHVRNPMLSGVFLLMFGIGFGVNSVSMVFFFSPLYVLFNYWELKVIEEPELLMRLGDEYAVYRKSTPMFIPGIGAFWTE